MKIFKYTEFLKESSINNNLPTYEQALELCSYDESPFYESKTTIDEYNISIFNYRLAQYKDFTKKFAKEMRGLTFIFNKDGSIYNRYILLEKFFNINQVPESMYSVVKNYKIKFVNNKEDGSIASFIKLPNGKVLGKSKMGFDNSQAIGINRIYRNNNNVKSFVNWCLNNNISPIFEYVSPTNRIVLRYNDDELILLRLRNNITGKHIDIRDHLDKIGSIRIAPFEDDFKDLDDLLELMVKKVDKEGSVITAVDEFGNDFFFKAKTPWYCSLHGLLSEDIYREHIIIGYILDDKIDDILGQIPEEQKEAHQRINKIISIVKNEINEKSLKIQKAYDDFIKSNMTKKEYALNRRVGNPYFSFVMSMAKRDELKKLSEEDVIKIYGGNFDYYESLIEKYEPYEMAKEWIREKTKKLIIARNWLKEKDPTLFFQDIEEDDDN